MRNTLINPDMRMALAVIIGLLIALGATMYANDQLTMALIACNSDAEACMKANAKLLTERQTAPHPVPGKYILPPLEDLGLYERGKR